MTVCRFIVDQPAEGAWNMALDEALLLSAERDGVAWLRFYRWQEPTLSLGYFQNHRDRQLHSASAVCKLVRRASGGGAILHDQELTYSIALPAGHPLSRRAELLYDAAHRSLIETLRDWNVKAALHAVQRLVIEGGTGKQRLPVPKQEQPFLCFQRHTPGDVLLAGHKIAGSAQRRHRGAVLQHGSVLLATSRFAPELPGIFDLAKNPAQTEDELRICWQRRLAEKLAFRLENTPIYREILTSAGGIQAIKFGQSDWTYRR